MKAENHAIKLKDHLSGLEWGIRQNNRSAVGFHASAGSAELLSLLLHKLEVIPIGFQINHAWFKSKKTIEGKFGFDFPKKAEILALMEDIEDLRDPLCYGSPKPEESLDTMIGKFLELRRIIGRLTGENYGEAE